MARLEMFFLGSFQVVLDGEPITDFESHKDRALLAYLAVERERPHMREKLADLLWPQQDGQAGRSNLRHSLSKLRLLLGDRGEPPERRFLRVTRQAIQFNQQSDSRGDWALFTCPAPTLRQLEKMAAAYCGPFLDGLCPADSPDFDRWVLFRRAQFQRQALDAFQQLAAHYAARGELDRALPLAWRQVELEPWREVGQRQLMGLLARSGRRGEALAQFEVCRKTLAEKLGIAPAAETVALAEQIGDGRLASAEGEVFAAAAVPQDAPRAGRGWLTAVLLLSALVLGLLFNRGPLPSARHSLPSGMPAAGKIVQVCQEEPPTAELCVYDVGRGSVQTVSLADGLLPQAGSPSWSPDGTQIVFSGWPAGEAAGMSRLYVIQADGEGQRPLTHGPHSDGAPVWSPDGGWIALQRDCRLWLMRPDGDDAHPVWGIPGLHCVGGIAWSPDGEQLAFLSNIDPTLPAPNQLWLVDQGNESPRLLYTFAEVGIVGQLGYSPDGEQIVLLGGIGDEPHNLLFELTTDSAPDSLDAVAVPQWWLASFWEE